MTPTPPKTPTPTHTTVPTGRPLLWLAATAAAYALTHHIGFGLAGLGTTGTTGTTGETRWADWIDLTTPYTLLLTAAATLHTAHAARRAWALYLTGAITYAEGHGIHLAANSVGNVAPSDTAHLWDETVGHYLWYTGLALVLTALAATLARRPPVHGALPALTTALLCATTAFTWTSNALEGRYAIPGIALAAAFTLWGLLTRRTFGRTLILAFAPALIMLTGYGIWHHGFPEPSDIGWV
ncbi:hypothetical protein GEV43_41285 [Actinomadura sp. J1-007]|uniref:hypothetical protein n=1 Tax=Actinomadura sp. J1-007 TaxID=2661913 RepID=UPI00132A4051|nr:hypothetical protein [Actinomadura sp. J1-007]MWK39783.1 hypothetical protein [Actinomadura sp. J1-007]